MVELNGLFEHLRAGGHVLCLGAHSDDIEIGCAGTLRKLTAGVSRVSVDWVVFSAENVREREARESAATLLSGVAERWVETCAFRNGFFPYVGAEIKDYFETLKTRPRPDLILTHRRRDQHQDHKTVAELTWNTFRDHLILEYEVPKYDGDLGRPNVFVPLSEAQVEEKCALLMRCFQSQHAKPWFTPETFRGLCRLRGVECGSATGFAEAFHGRKLVLS